MRPLRPLWGALAVMVAAAAVTSAQSLGELAAKEQERREKERQKRGGASKVITESDLRGGGRGTLSNAGSTSTVASPEPSASPAADASKPAAAAPKEKSADEIRTEQENDWRQRMQRARADETRLTERVDRLQRGLNDLTAPLYGSGRTALLKEFEAARAELTAARQKIVDLEEEGRTRSFR